MKNFKEDFGNLCEDLTEAQSLLALLSALLSGHDHLVLEEMELNGVRFILEQIDNRLSISIELLKTLSKL
jgi:hypothetical protein